MQTVYEDNHIIIVNKKSGEIVQKDKSGDSCLMDDVREYLKVKYNKPGNVFLGLPHRLDRPTSGLVVLAKTDKALSRLSEMFRENKINKTYLAVTDAELENDEGTLSDYLVRNERENKSYVVKKETAGAKAALLKYKYCGKSDRYYFYMIELITGRHHQIRVQFASRGVHIKGDLKYGAKRSNPDGSINLHSFALEFVHPVSGKNISVHAWPSDSTDKVWTCFKECCKTDLTGLI